MGSKTRVQADSGAVCDMCVARERKGGEGQCREGEEGRGGTVFYLCIYATCVLRERGEKGREKFVCVCICDICVEREGREGGGGLSLCVYM